MQLKYTFFQPPLVHSAPLCVLLPNPQQPIRPSQRGSNDKNSQIGQCAVDVRCRQRCCGAMQFQLPYATAAVSCTCSPIPAVEAHASALLYHTILSLAYARAYRRVTLYMVKCFALVTCAISFAAFCYCISALETKCASGTSGIRSL